MNEKGLLISIALMLIFGLLVGCNINGMQDRSDQITRSYIETEAQYKKNINNLR